MVRARELESEARHLAAKVLGVACELLAQVVARLDEVQHRERGMGDRRHEGIREEIRARAVAQPRHDFARARRIAARRAAERLAERAGQELDPAHHAAMLRRAAATRADEADRVRVVHHHHRAVLLREVANSREIGNNPIHRKHAVGRDELVARSVGRRGLQLRLEVRHVVVGIAEALRFRKPHAVDDRGVVQRVRDHRVLFPQERLEEAAVRVEARAVEDRVLGAEEFRDAALELAVHVLGAADEAHRRHPIAMLGDTLRSGRRD